MLRWVRIGTFDLDETLGADGLVTTASLVQIGRIVNEANGALGRILIQECLDPLTVDVRIFLKLDFLRCHLRLRIIARTGGERCEGLCASSEEW